jgi:hypothetical protein
MGAGAIGAGSIPAVALVAERTVHAALARTSICLFTEVVILMLLVFLTATSAVLRGGLASRVPKRYHKILKFGQISEGINSAEILSVPGLGPIFSELCLKKAQRRADFF